MQLFTAVLLLTALLMPWRSFSQTITLKPNATAGQDVIIVNTHSCTPNNWPGPGETLNFEPTDDLEIAAWTIHAGGCGNVEIRSLLRFDGISQLCKNTTVDYAELRLFGVPNSLQAPQGNSHYFGSPYLAWGPNNYGWVRRALNPWAENTVTWNTQPGTTNWHRQLIHTSTAQWSENYTIPITQIVQDLIDSGNNGVMLQLDSELIYRNINWASSDNVDPRLWPELYIVYHCCNPNFTYCSGTRHPNTFNFSAEDPSQPYIYNWDFGDGNTATGPNATNTYAAVGSYKVCLTLIDQQTKKVVCEKCITICVNDIAEVDPNDGDPNGGGDPNGNPSKKGNPDGTQAIKGTAPVLDGTLILTSLTPNPAHTSISANVQLIKGCNVEYKVYGIDGSMVMSGKKLMDKGAQSLSLPIEKLAPGLYILEMQDQFGSKASSKFSKE